MKKLVALLLATAMMFTCVACGGNAEGGNTEGNNVKVEIADATELFTKVWEEYKASAGEDLQFPAGGSNPETMVMDVPGKFDPTIEYAEDSLLMQYCIPADTVAKTDDIIVIAGKGHETYQILGTTKIHYDEREIIADIIGR